MLTGLINCRVLCVRSLRTLWSMVWQIDWTWTRFLTHYWFANIWKIRKSVFIYCTDKWHLDESQQNCRWVLSTCKVITKQRTFSNGNVSYSSIPISVFILLSGNSCLFHFVDFYCIRFLTDGLVSSAVTTHYSDVILSAMASQTTSITAACSAKRTSNKTSKLRFTGLCEGNPSVTRGFPSQRTSNEKNVSIWWRHHEWLHVPLAAICQTFWPSRNVAEAWIPNGSNSYKMQEIGWKPLRLYHSVIYCPI